MEVSFVEITHATKGMEAMANDATGTLNITDCAFRGVWNRSSIGQVIPIKVSGCIEDARTC